MSLLEEAIEKYKIPRWPYQAVFDRVVVYTLPEEKATRDTYVKGGQIYMPEKVKEAVKHESPRAIIVSAGLWALDILASHGLGLGSVCWVARLSPWRHQVERTAEGKDVEFMFLRAGDVVGSETLLEYVRQGKCQVTKDAEGRHHYVFDGDVVPRFDPPSYVA